MRTNLDIPDIRELRLFDACVTFGRVVRAGTPEAVTAGNVLQVLDKYDIVEALVHHVEARLNTPRDLGNRRLLREIEDVSRLHPVWVLDPPQPSSPDAARAMVEEMLAAGVKAARLMMAVAPPLHWVWKDLLGALEAHRVPCLLDFADPRYRGNAGSTMGSPDAFALHRLRECALAHPELPLILSHVCCGVGLEFPVLPLVRECPNVHLDILGIIKYWRTVATEAGPERVLFATGMPFVEPATFISNAQYARRLSLEDKKKICGGNLRRLLGGVR